MKRLMSIFFVFLLTIMAFAQTTVFINEIHYDNVGSDTGEFIEVAGPSGTDLAGWSIEFYRDDGTIYSTINLSGTITNLSNGFGTLSFSEPGIQNGPSDGFALVDNTNTAKQFLSYEGTLTATEGSANGLTSTDIGVEESGSTPAGHSLQLSGFGKTYEDFTWQAPADDTPGAINNDQVFDADNPIASITTMASGTLEAQLSDAISGIESVKVEVLNGGTLQLNSQSVNQGDTFMPVSPTDPVSIDLTGSAGNKTRLIVTDRAGNETVWFFDFMQ